MKKIFINSATCCSLLASCCLLISCSDFDDYNSLPVISEESANKTIMEVIDNSGNMQDFSRLLKLSGVEETLRGATDITVWAPLDGTYDAQSMIGEEGSVILKQFIKNHISFYSHSLKEGETQRIRTLNGKSYDFSTEKFGQQQIRELNIPCSNGFLHTINGRQRFYPNVYEYIMNSADDIDSVRTYFSKFETTYLDTENSIPGPMVGGKQTYIDSVMVTTNTLFSRFRAYISREDSSYLALLPTDKSWNGIYNRIKPYYNYVAKTAAQEYDANTGNATTKFCNIRQEAFKDSLIRYSIMSKIFFNTNDYWNRWAIGRPDAETRDTLYSTTRELLTNGLEMLSQSIQTDTMSNGIVQKVDSMALMRSTWAPDLRLLAASGTYRAKCSGAAASSVSMAIEDMNLSKVPLMEDTLTSYVDIVPTSNYSKPDIIYYLPNVLSANYEIIAVIMPADIRRGYDGDVKPNKFSATISYSDANGTLKTKTLGKAYVNDTSKVDYLSLGTMKFPVAYRGLGSYYPTIEIQSTVGTSKAEKEAFDREIRLAAIIMKPID